MVETPEDHSDAIRKRLVDLVDYVEHMVRLGQKPVLPAANTASLLITKPH